MFNIAILSISDFENWDSLTNSCMGGTSGVIKSILPYLSADKIYLMGITGDKKNLYKEKIINDNIIAYPIVYIPKSSKIPDRIWAFWYGKNINSILRRCSINSVYVHSEEMAYHIRPEFPILYHMHGSTNALVKAKNKYLRHFIFQNIWERLRKKNIKMAKKIIAIDLLCYEITKKQKRQNDTILLPNFVDTKIFFKDIGKSDLLSNIQENIVLFVGRLEEVKGLELFVDTVNELDIKEKGKWKGVLVGRGSYQKIIEKYIEQKSHSNLFNFAGAVFDQVELRKIYSQSSVLMISSHHEGIPMVILESLACQTPVVSTNVGGVKSLISDVKSCCVIDERKASLFVERILGMTSPDFQFSDENFKFSAKAASFMINKILITK